MKKSLLFCLILITLFSSVHWLIDRGLQKTGFGNYGEWNDLFNGRAAADILIQGSSRAWVQVDPAIIEAVSGKTAYNLGLDGYDFSLQSCRYQLYRQYNPAPQTVIQILDIATLNRRQDLYMYEQFLPYYHEEQLVRTISQFQGFSWAHYYLPLAKYAGRYTYARIGLEEFLGLAHYRSSKYKGYRGQEITWTGAFEAFTRDYPQGITQPTDPGNIAAFDRFLAEAAHSGVQVILVYAPEYYQVNDYLRNKAEILAIYQDFADKYGIPFYDFSDNYLSQDQRYFYNAEHLNKAGAELFSRQLADLLPG